MPGKPLAIELFCGTFGWSDGWLALGGRSIGFDLEHLPHHGPVPANAELVLQDVLTLDGRQFREASIILASPPCQAYSYRAMPWKRAKALMPDAVGLEKPDWWDRPIAKMSKSEVEAWRNWEAKYPAPPPDRRLFDACFRIQREASAAAGRHIPMVVENVKGAQPWVGRAKAHYGSYYLWGDVENIGGRIVRSGPVRFGMAGVRAAGRRKPDELPSLNGHDDPRLGRSTVNGSWFGIGADGKSNLADSGSQKVPGFNFHQHEKGEPGGSFQSAAVKVSGLPNGTFPAGELAQGYLDREGVKQSGSGAAGFDDAGHVGNKNRTAELNRPAGMKRADSRRAASALIAKIPYALSEHIARVYWPLGRDEHGEPSWPGKP
jgi:hypothetical protein